MTNRKATFIPYQPKTILNKGKRADHWFWTRYSAYPYIGCQHGCEFCYCREKKYCPHDDPLDFAYSIKIKENAPVLLRRALSRAPVDLVFTGDYQPVERKFGISRKMLEVCYELGFPVFVLERNPGVLRDLDLLQAINQRSRCTQPTLPFGGPLQHHQHPGFAELRSSLSDGAPGSACRQAFCCHGEDRRGGHTYRNCDDAHLARVVR